MKKPFIAETMLTIILIAILLILLSPLDLLMPMKLETILPILLVIVFLIFTVFFWKEKSRDERENYHTLHAGRVSFFIGSAVLILGIVIESLHHNIDSWLIFTLIGMTLGKVLSRIYTEIKQ